LKKSTGEIVFCVRRNYLTSPGGDSVQIQTWVSVFQRMNFEIKIFREPVTDRDFHHAALVFVWHLERLHESYQPWETARKKNIPVILVPTFWYNGKRGILYPVVRQCELWIRYILFRKSSTCPLTHLWSNCRKNLLTKSNLLLANSFAEKQLLIREGANPEKISVIPNVIQLTDFSFSEKIPWERRTRIVCVGHFCPRKNQLALIRALKGTDISITFIGSARPMHQRYLRRCKTEAGSRHIFLEYMNHRDTIKMLMESRVSISVSQ